MSEQDYKAGEQGLRWSPTMDRGDYEAGKAARADKEAIAAKNVQPQFGPSGSGAGAGLLLLIPLFPFLYPVAGVAAVGWAFTMYKFTNTRSINGFIVLLLVFVAPIAVFLYAKRWETKVAVRFRLYRIFRMLLRWAAVTFFAVMILSSTGNRYVTKDPSPGQILAGILIAAFSHLFIFRRLDRWEKNDSEA